MNKELDESTINRLALGIMRKFNCDYPEAMERLGALSLNLICGEGVRENLPLQAALLTAINCASRAFLGKINVVMPDNISCLLPWPGNKTLNEIAIELGGIHTTKADNEAFSLMFAQDSLDDGLSLEVVCNSWQGGVINFGCDIKIGGNGFLPLGGIAAGAIAVGCAFLKVSTIDITAQDNFKGISLWRPDLLWHSEDANGPEVKILPEKFWLLGLGHLGQGYLWNIGLLPYNDVKRASCILQDYDRISEANWSTGLLCNLNQIKSKEYKTRICASWLEQRKFETILVERKFDENIKTERKEGEPLVALCGFDSAPPRALLEGADFDVIIEAGLGKDIVGFDAISMHTFPSSGKSAKTLWNIPFIEESDKLIQEKFEKLTPGCGIVAITIAQKAIASSFVGALAGSLAIAEIIRGYNNGIRTERISLRIRNLQDINVGSHPNCNWKGEFAANGYINFMS